MNILETWMIFWLIILVDEPPVAKPVKPKPRPILRQREPSPEIEIFEKPVVREPVKRVVAPAPTPPPPPPSQTTNPIIKPQEEKLKPKPKESKEEKPKLKEPPPPSTYVEELQVFIYF